MEILGIGPLEALFVLVLALIFIGPRDMGRHARSMGRALNRLYRSEAWRDLTQASRNLRSLPNRLAREAALEELDQVHRDLRSDVSKEIDEVRAAVTQPAEEAAEQIAGEGSATGESPGSKAPPESAEAGDAAAGEPEPQV